MTMNESATAGILRAVFDALPSLVFVVDEDVAIQDCNAAATELLTAEKAAVIDRRAGEVLHCVHVEDSPQGCGRGAFCKDCVIRNSVAEAFKGNRVTRRRTRIEFLSDGQTTEIFALITASPFAFHDRKLALLVIEDISEIAELRRILPVCSVCRKLRDDRESWVRIEAYFAEHWDVAFSHGYCPECLENEMKKVRAASAAWTAAHVDGNNRQG